MVKSWFLMSWMLAGAFPALSNSGIAAVLFPRRIPQVVEFNELKSGAVLDRAVPLPEADTRSFTAIRVIPSANSVPPSRSIRSGIVLVKIRGWLHVAAVHVESGREAEALGVLRGRADVDFAELDVVQKRQFMPDDSQIGRQWHHGVIRSFAAWDINLGQPFVRIAIVDTPFQMDHPDLAAHAAIGWDLVNERAITNSVGISHSTLCAGMAAAVIDNHLGVAGASNRCPCNPLRRRRTSSR